MEFENRDIKINFFRDLFDMFTIDSLDKFTISNIRNVISIDIKVNMGQLDENLKNLYILIKENIKENTYSVLTLFDNNDYYGISESYALISKEEVKILDLYDYIKSEGEKLISG